MNYRARTNNSAAVHCSASSMCLPLSLHPGTTQPILRLHKLVLGCSLCNLLLIHPSAETRRPDQPLHHHLIQLLRQPGSDVWVFPSTCTRPDWVEKMPVCKHSLLLQRLLLGVPWPTGASVTFISLPKITIGCGGSLGMDQTDRSLKQLEDRKDTFSSLLSQCSSAKVCGIYLDPLHTWKGPTVGSESLL